MIFHKHIIITLLIGFCLATTHNTALAKPTGLSKDALSRLAQIEDSLVVFADSMLKTEFMDERMPYCVKFTKTLRQALDMEGSFAYPFSKLDQKIRIVTADDKKFRIFNWLVSPSPSLVRYFGVIQMNAEEPQYFPMKDYSDKLEKNATTSTLTPEHWYGCELYNMTSTIINGQKAYLLFGFNNDGFTSSKKILDVLTFDNGKPYFGLPIFNVPDNKNRNLVQQNRIIFEFKKTATCFLNYDAEKKMILFDRLESEITDPNRKNTYIPTGQLDGLRFDNGQYIYVTEAVKVLRLRDGQAPVDGVLNSN
jgi:hypothetical protein